MGVVSAFGIPGRGQRNASRSLTQGNRKRKRKEQTYPWVRKTIVNRRGCRYRVIILNRCG